MINLFYKWKLYYRVAQISCVLLLILFLYLVIKQVTNFDKNNRECAYSLPEIGNYLILENSYYDGRGIGYFFYGKINNVNELNSKLKSIKSYKNLGTVKINQENNNDQSEYFTISYISIDSNKSLDFFNAKKNVKIQFDCDKTYTYYQNYSEDLAIQIIINEKSNFGYIYILH